MEYLTLGSLFRKFIENVRETSLGSEIGRAVSINVRTFSSPGCDEFLCYNILGAVTGLAAVLERTATALNIEALCDAETTHGADAMHFRKLPCRVQRLAL